MTSPRAIEVAGLPGVSPIEQNSDTGPHSQLRDSNHPAIQRALRRLRETQEQRTHTAHHTHHTSHATHSKGSW